jgi:hypothetical protein
MLLQGAVRARSGGRVVPGCLDVGRQGPGRLVVCDECAHPDAARVVPPGADLVQGADTYNQVLDRDSHRRGHANSEWRRFCLMKSSTGVRFARWRIRPTQTSTSPPACHPCHTPRARSAQDDSKRDATPTAVASLGTAAPDLGQIMVQAAAASVAHQIRTSVSTDVWALLLDQLRRELGISQEDVFDQFD